MLPIAHRRNGAGKREQKEERSSGLMKRLPRGAPQRFQKSAHSGIDRAKTHMRILVQSPRDAKPCLKRHTWAFRGW